MCPTNYNDREPVGPDPVSHFCEEDFSLRSLEDDYYPELLPGCAKGLSLFIRGEISYEFQLAPVSFEILGIPAPESYSTLAELGRLLVFDCPYNRLTELRINAFKKFLKEFFQSDEANTADYDEFNIPTWVINEPHRFWYELSRSSEGSIVRQYLNDIDCAFKGFKAKNPEVYSAFEMIKGTALDRARKEGNSLVDLVDENQNMGSMLCCLEPHRQGIEHTLANFTKNLLSDPVALKKTWKSIGRAVCPDCFCSPDL